MAGAEHGGEAPVRLHARRLVCENTVFSVFFDHVSGAGGHDVLQYLSVVPRHEATDGITGVSVLPVMGDRLGLIRVFRHPVRRWAWEVPKGFLDAGETLDQAALRELCEETGFGIQTDRLRRLGVVTPEPGVLQGRLQAFVALLDESDTRQSVTNGELGHGAMQFFSRSEIAQLIAAGSIEDAATLALMFLHFGQAKAL
jgi:8-oxo-dGTP pyrophosphatase MutT (NUDIX family)